MANKQKIIVTGYIRTEFECPTCKHTSVVDGDVSDTYQECDVCFCSVFISGSITKESHKVKVFLTRRNLKTLLAKLDKNKICPGTSACTIIKSDTIHKTYPLTGADQIWVTGVEDEEYYIDREPGAMIEDLE